ncbi:CBU_0592 family membrane protein [Ruegeria atlantica]|uniref:CBU_0592 family membrane protein n=1 Tax=Ruegeria atlantica TaxID=81569 RepID=UPI00147CC1F4|nr:hypothetical protein [Ruegeria atlantica]
MTLLQDLTFVDGLGILGSAIIICVYYLATRNILPADKIAFNAWNIAGGSLVMLSLIYRPNPGAIVMEVMFLGIATLAVLRNLRGAK